MPSKTCVQEHALRFLGTALAVLTLTACAPILLGGVVTAVALTEDRRTSGAFVDDETIENRALLKVKSRFGDQVHVNITSYNRQVLLSGEANTDVIKRGVEDEVSTVPGIKRSFNEMTVGPQAGVIAVSNDTRLTTIVKTRFLEANKALHVAIAQATGNGRLAAMVDQLLDQMTRLLHLGLGLRNRSHEMQHEHRALLKALSRGDGETAERISRQEIEAARGMVLSAIMTSNSVMNLAITEHG